MKRQVNEARWSLRFSSRHHLSNPSSVVLWESVVCLDTASRPMESEANCPLFAGVKGDRPDALLSQPSSASHGMNEKLEPILID